MVFVVRSPDEDLMVETLWLWAARGATGTVASLQKGPGFKLY